MTEEQDKESIVGVKVTRVTVTYPGSDDRIGKWEGDKRLRKTYGASGEVKEKS